MEQGFEGVAGRRHHVVTIAVAAELLAAYSRLSATFLQSWDLSMVDKQEIIDLEKQFWDTMVSRDVEAASAMVANRSIVTGARGVSEISRDDFGKIMKGSTWTLDSYKMSDVQVLFPTKDTAIIAYKVRQKGTMDGEKPFDMEAADTTVWNREGTRWLCVLHTEAMIGNA